MRISPLISRSVNLVLNQPIATVALWLTCFVLAVTPFGGDTFYRFHIGLLAVAVIMVCSRRLLYSSAVWLLIFLLLTILNIITWHYADNHKYLIAYWVLACGIAVSRPDSEQVLAWNGRYLIGVSFLFATAWKILAGEYLDGSFLYGTFLLRSPFQGIPMLVGGLSEDELKLNYELFAILRDNPSAEIAILPVATDALYIFALISSYWTIFIEGLIAFSFLSQRPNWINKNRDYFLLAFLATTYIIAPVALFGMTLTVLGWAQCNQEFKWRRLSYLLIFTGLQFVELAPDALVQIAKLL